MYNVQHTSVLEIALNGENAFYIMQFHVEYSDEITRKPPTFQ